MLSTQKIHNNDLIIWLTAAVVGFSVIVHVLHRQFGFLSNYLTLQSISAVTGGQVILLNLLFLLPIAMLAGTVLVFHKKRQHPLVPMMNTLILTFASISIIAGGNGLVEYHFSIFMVIAIIATYQQISLIVVSTVIFAVHHLAGYFLFPQLLCGTENYSFSLLLIHALFLILTSGANVIIIYYTRQNEARLLQETEETEQVLQETLQNIEQESTLLKGATNLVQESAIEVSETSKQISDALLELKDATTEEVNIMEQALGNNLENMASFEQIYSQTNQVASFAQDSLLQASNGQEKIESVSRQMQNFTESIGSINELTDTLSSRSKEITSLLNAIHSISEQTQLLALNASIEAARAGEHGNGFAVVADEIRKLAISSQQSAKEIDDVMLDIQAQIATVATKMETSLNEVRIGNQSIASTEESFDAIVTSISDIEQMMHEIIDATNDLFKRTEETTELYKEITNSTNHNVENIGIISEASSGQYQTIESLDEAILKLDHITDDLAVLIKKVR